jgi:dTDP-4-dehydrorhamnose reductase
MKILVIGASGLLGRKTMVLGQIDHQMIGTYFSTKNLEGLANLDLTSLDLIQPFLNSYHPQAVIYTAGITDEKFAEEQPRLAKLVNVDAAHVIAHWCEEHQVKMVYVSTEYVFDGTTGPYDEKSTPYPLQIYGYTKLLAELNLQDRPNCAILRVGLLHGFNDFADKPTDTMMVLQALQQRQPLKLDDYRIKYPYLIDDIAKYLLWLAKTDEHGIFHAGGGDGVTRYQWGLKIATVFGLDSALLIPDSNKDKNSFPLKPRHVKLRDTRVGFPISGLEESLLTIKQQMME